ncbi:cell wall protein [Streptomyces sp. SID8352]|uniref:cell wall protein n=1 Tax=Streptomyces sp. SID8352 TaxID=2690338 RepID=UPI001367D7E3|nr:cell wall protein [Streptomyces sp. SID8352]MYU23406.1 cell wall protein [Streptomyces sp. SID8352]
MKLRRAAVTVAAMSAIAPLALASAPAALATGGVSPAATILATGDETPGTAGDTAADDDTPPATGEGTASPSEEGAPSGEDGEDGTDSGPGDTEGTEDGTGDDTTGGETDGTDDTDGTATPDASTTPTATPTTPAPTTSAPSPSAEPSGPAESTAPADPEDPELPDVPYCEELDEDYASAKVSADVRGLPGRIVAGDGRHPFQLVVTNRSAVDVRQVAFYAEVENYELTESEYLSPHVTLEFREPGTGAWQRIGDDEWAGDYFLFTDGLKAGATTTVDLRVSVGAGAPAGDAYTFGAGAYLDDVEGESCLAEGWGQYDFQVLAPGSGNPDPGTAQPNGTRPGTGAGPTVKQPQGGISALPQGSLAATGTGSGLPVIGLAGGLAVLAGAGAVLTARRRGAGALG